MIQMHSLLPHSLLSHKQCIQESSIACQIEACLGASTPGCFETLRNDIINAEGHSQSRDRHATTTKSTYQQDGVFSRTLLFTSCRTLARPVKQTV